MYDFTPFQPLAREGYKKGPFYVATFSCAKGSFRVVITGSTRGSEPGPNGVRTGSEKRGCGEEREGVLGNTAKSDVVYKIKYFIHDLHLHKCMATFTG